MKPWKILALWMLISCNEIKDCQLDPNRDFATMTFYSADSLRLETPKKTPKALDFNELRISAFPGETFEGDSILSVGLPLNPDDSVIIYSFTTDSTTYDLTLRYDHSLFIYELDCPPTFSYKNLKASWVDLDSLSDGIDTVIVISPILKRDFPLNLEIYF